MLGSALLIAAATLLMAVIDDVTPATIALTLVCGAGFGIALTLVWGAGFGAVPVATQTWTAQTMPANVEGGLRSLRRCCKDLSQLDRPSDG